MWLTESIKLYIEDQAIPPSYFYLAHLAPPLPLPSPVSKVHVETQEDWERETTCWQKRRGAGVGAGAKS